MNRTKKQPPQLKLAIAVAAQCSFVVLPSQILLVITGRWAHIKIWADDHFVYTLLKYEVVPQEHLMIARQFIAGLAWQAIQSQRDSEQVQDVLSGLFCLAGMRVPIIEVL